jgi:hypothetical protein
MSPVIKRISSETAVFIFCIAGLTAFISTLYQVYWLVIPTWIISIVAFAVAAVAAGKDFIEWWRKA